MSIDLDPTMHAIAQVALLNVLSQFTRSMEEVHEVVGHDLSQADRAALVDFSGAAKRLAKTLSADEVGE